ncbi:MAG TPA: ABC transporter substrate-binding protein [Candidatus Sulfotelmatobacter sp.]|nr:ABC transporter substrate-binding protein [Candidatus Sulfotelmatobacter sp.]
MPDSTTPHGTLLMGEWSPPDTLNLWFASSFSTLEAMQPSMRGFVAITSDGKYIPDLATTVPTPENGGVVVNGTTFDVKVTLKPDLKWSDGTPLTMDDFVATWKWATDPAQTGCLLCTTGWPDIGGIDESTDRLTATIHFKDLYSGWLGFLTSGPWPARYLDSVPIAKASTLYPLSAEIAKVPFNGPFTITSASKTEIDYAPNPYWAGGVSTAHAPYLAGLKFVYYGDKNGEITDFLAGKLDLALALNQGDYPAVAKVDPSVGSAEEVPVWRYEYLDINNDPNHTRGNDLWDPAVRKALAMAVDKSDLISVLFPGQSIQPACSPAPPGLWYGVTETCPAYDQAGAVSALEAAGLAVGGDGDFQYQGKDLDLELCTFASSPAELTELQKVQGYLQAVHIKSYVKTVDASSVLYAAWSDTTPTTDCSIYRGNYDLAAFTYVISGSPYNDYYYTYAADQWPEKGDHSGTNDTRFDDPSMDEALATLKSAVDLQAQADAAKAVQDAYVAGTPEIPLFYRAETTGVSVHVGNWPGYAASSFGELWNVEDWYYIP